MATYTSNGTGEASNNNLFKSFLSPLIFQIDWDSGAPSLILETLNCQYFIHKWGHLYSLPFTEL